MDAIKNNNIGVNAGLTAISHPKRSEQIETSLQSQSIALSQLSTEERANYSSYAAQTLENIDRVSKLGIGPHKDLKPTKFGDGDLEFIFPDPTVRSQTEEKELEEKIREKEDPNYNREKRAEKAAKKLNMLFSGINPDSIIQGIDLNNLNKEPSRQDEHRRDGQIIDALYDIKTEDMQLVKVDYEKNFGETLENEVLHRFRGNVQQKLLGLVRGNTAPPAGNAEGKA